MEKADIRIGVKTAVKSQKKKSNHKKVPNEEMVQLGFITDWDETAQEYKDPEIVQDEGEMVVETAKSIQDYQAHYDEVADKKNFHKDLPLSNYQKIVDANMDAEISSPDQELQPSLKEMTASITQVEDEKQQP